MRPGKTRARGARRARRGTARRPPAFTIRRGTARDVPAILALIRGLAEYERLAHEVEATAARVRRHGFGRRPYFETLICRSGRTPVGFALYFFTYSTFLARPTLYLEDLFVVPAERGTGGGKALLAALARIAVRREREEALKEIDRAEKAKEISEDEKFRKKQEAQKVVDDFNKKIDEIGSAKEKEIMTP